MRWGAVQSLAPSPSHLPVPQPAVGGGSGTVGTKEQSAEVWGMVAISSKSPLLQPEAHNLHFPGGCNGCWTDGRLLSSALLHGRKCVCSKTLPFRAYFCVCCEVFFKYVLEVRTLYLLFPLRNRNKHRMKKLLGLSHYSKEQCVGRRALAIFSEAGMVNKWMNN